MSTESTTCCSIPSASDKRPELPESFQDDLLVLFRHFDNDRNGKISKNEFSKIRKSAERYGCIFGNFSREEMIFRELSMQTVEQELYDTELARAPPISPGQGRSGSSTAAYESPAVKMNRKLGYPTTPGTPSELNQPPGIDFYRFHRYLIKRHTRHPAAVKDWLDHRVIALQEAATRKGKDWQERLTVYQHPEASTTADCEEEETILRAPPPVVHDVDQELDLQYKQEKEEEESLPSETRPAMDSFLNFNGSVSGMYARYKNLYTISGFDSRPCYDELRRVVRPECNYSQKAIFDRFIGVRTQRPEYISQDLEGCTIVIIGAGPVGLRSAIEVALLGGKAVVLEKRNDFTRPNILHLWTWIQYDLIGLGAKVVDPNFGASSAFLHIGTRELQTILYKVCLLIGVEVHFGYDFQEIELCRNSANVVATHPSKGRQWFPCDSVIDCGGVHKPAARTVDIDYSNVKMADAIGMVASFEHNKTREETLLKEFSWACQYNTQLFEDIKRVCHAQLENVVYYQGNVHYFICTPKRQNLIEEGVLEPVSGYDQKQREGPLDGVTINYNKAALYIGRISKYFGVNTDLHGAPNIFDFSSRSNAMQPCRIIGDEADQMPFMVMVSGDALLEPFWPEGLGIARGFLSAFDTVWSLRGLKSARGDADALQRMADNRMQTFAVSKQVSAFTKGRLLLEDERKFTLDPATRYKCCAN